MGYTKYFNGKCYGFADDNPGTVADYDTAQEACMNMSGGFVAEVRNAEDSEVIGDIRKENG